MSLETEGCFKFVKAEIAKEISSQLIRVEYFKKIPSNRVSWQIDFQ